MVNVVVANKKIVKVSTNVISGVITTNIPITLKNNPVIESGGSTGATSLNQMMDINFLDATTGATLIYDANIDKFIVEPLQNIDCGVF